MDTQNTPVHITLWRRDFWLLAIVNLLLSVVVYMQLSGLDRLVSPMGFAEVTDLQRGLLMGIYGVGIFLLGPYCQYLVQKYKRKRVCLYATVCMLLLMLLMDFMSTRLHGEAFFYSYLLAMFWFGAFFGLAQMILSSTLILDVTESGQRTEANYASAWFRRMALSFGPLLAILVPFDRFTDIKYAVAVTVFVLLGLVRIPFKTPDDNFRVFCLDRFYLKQGTWLTLNLLPVTMALGISAAIAAENSIFFVQLGIGFVIAFVSEKFVFANADLRSEFVTGCILLLAAYLFYLTRSGVDIVEYMAPAMIGIGSGLIGSRILMFFIKLTRHCQRGTAQSTYFLSWELGLAAGLFLGNWIADYHTLDVIAIVLIAVALIAYSQFVHPWYIKHKNR